MNTYRMPAEWEQQSMVQLTWPHVGTDWAPILSDITHTYVQMAREIAAREHLLIVVPANSNLPKEIATLENTTIVNCPTNDTWARDHAFITLVPTNEDNNGDNLPPLLLDFRFNGWGEKFEHQLDNAINATLFKQPQLFRGCLYGDMNDFILEGGSIESDGNGTIFTTSQCLLAPHRNQPLSQADIEQQLKLRLYANRIVWLDHGNLIGDDTDGHIDTIVRTAPDDTLIYVSCNDSCDDHFHDFKALEQQLIGLRTTGNKPYRLLPLPIPDPIYDGDDRLPATYANFLVINSAVLVPTYNQPHNDSVAMKTIQQAFPQREIIPIDSRSIIRQHGSIHCCTMQFPSEVMKKNLKTRD